jgi:hypothetical protein
MRLGRVQLTVHCGQLQPTRNIPLRGGNKQAKRSRTPASELAQLSLRSPLWPHQASCKQQ